MIPDVRDRTMSGISTISSILYDISGSTMMISQSSFSSFYITMTQIMSLMETMTQIEANNNNTLRNMNVNTMLTSMAYWASQGYPATQLVYTFNLQTPIEQAGQYLCSDGQYRAPWDYIVYCLGYSIADHITNMQSIFGNVELSFSVGTIPSLVLNIYATMTPPPPP
jgi:hypothetical protein